MNRRGGGATAGLVILLLLVIALVILAFSGVLPGLLQNLLNWLQGQGLTTAVNVAKTGVAKSPTSSGSTTPPAASRVAATKLSASAITALKAAAARARRQGTHSGAPVPGIAVTTGAAGLAALQQAGISSSTLASIRQATGNDLQDLTVIWDGLTQSGVIP